MVHDIWIWVDPKVLVEANANGEFVGPNASSNLSLILGSSAPPSFRLEAVFTEKKEMAY